MIDESTPLASIKIRKSYFLALPSIASEKALINPAIGAFIRSSWQPSLRSRQRTSLYAQLDKVAKLPNLAQSKKKLDFLLKRS